MQKTFKLGPLEGKYKVQISKKSKVNIATDTEEINFYFANPRYANAEEEYLTNFLEYRLCLSKANEIKNYILSNVCTLQ
jgi:hypothetical protein